MGCACQGGAGRKQYEVVSSDGTKVLFTTAHEPTAQSVSTRYAGSTVREKGATTAAPKTA